MPINPHPLQPHGSAPSATARIYLLLFPVPVICFIGALVTDVAYASGAQLMYLHFSEWLIAVGLAFGALAALALIVALAANRGARSGPLSWAHLGLLFAALLVELCNAFWHTIDGWTAVVPGGLILSSLGSLLSLAAVATLMRTPTTWAEPVAGRPELQT